MYVIIAGAGLIGYQIAKELVTNNHDVVVIDANIKVCETIYAETGAITIAGNATDIKILEKAGANKAEAIVCLMHNHADNMSCAMLAKSLGIPNIIARLRDVEYEEAYRLAGVTSLVRVADILVNQIMMEIEQPKVRQVVSFGGGRAQVYAVKIPLGVNSVGRQIKDIAQHKDFPKECVIIGFYKEEKGDFLIPRGEHTLQQGDTVFFVSKSQYVKKASEVLTQVL